MLILSTHLAEKLLLFVFRYDTIRWVEKMFQETTDGWNSNQKTLKVRNTTLPAVQLETSKILNDAFLTNLYSQLRNIMTFS